MKSTTKRSLITVALLTAATLVSSGAGAQSGGFLYFRTYYSDATLTTQVGTSRDRCTNGNVTTGPVNGTATSYVVLEAIGTCPGGYW